MIGATKLAQLEDNLAALNWTLSDEEAAILNSVSEKEKPYPYWHICNVAGDRRLATISTPNSPCTQATRVCPPGAYREARS
ncbi:oxidoreductase, aldo/keto reductase family [Klebsiella variicola]|uniref:Oxidoreductase, aldo/keto reductase family n=1 Tax=Klebsiella variicola TaxID=244366 RepID=A0A7H4MJ85_KLEVA|nr:oxidoreductase, aldo/keto reductase family [Klebsiella variicola]